MGPAGIVLINGQEIYTFKQLCCPCTQCSHHIHQTCTEILLTVPLLQKSQWNELAVVKCRVPVLFRAYENTDTEEDKQLLGVTGKHIFILLSCTYFYSFGQ